MVNFTSGQRNRLANMGAQQNATRGGFTHDQIIERSDNRGFHFRSRGRRTDAFET